MASALDIRKEVSCMHVLNRQDHILRPAGIWINRYHRNHTANLKIRINLRNYSYTRPHSPAGKDGVADLFKRNQCSFNRTPDFLLPLAFCCRNLFLDLLFLSFRFLLKTFSILFYPEDLLSSSGILPHFQERLPLFLYRQKPIQYYC